MMYLAAPIIVSYILFVFVAEHLNPLKTFRENGKRRRIHEGRKVALAAIPIGYAMIFALYFVTSGTTA